MGMTHNQADTMPLLALYLGWVERGRRSHRTGVWRLKPVQKHLQHARKHLDLLASGDGGEDHLAHAACRLLMALELRERTAQSRVASPTAAETATDSDQMSLFAGVAPTRQT
jgi:dATP/dGTP diphosphohydrolase